MDEPELLSTTRWQELASRHRAQIHAWVAPRAERRRSGLKDPVDDFLFEYYDTRPRALAAWRPGYLYAVEDSHLARAEFGELQAMELIDGRWQVDRQVYQRADERRLTSVRWILDLLQRSGERTPRHDCFGLHEWAMVLDADRVRHETWRLRLSNDEIADVIGSQVRCTHFDAFRFFTSAARPLNVLELTRATQPDNDQPGCVHVTMDLFKWGMKLAPVVGSETLRDAFGLARIAREVDMRASPYDLADLGLEPIRIETADGRAEYARAQRELTEAAAPIRADIVTAVTLAIKKR